VLIREICGKFLFFVAAFVLKLTLVVVFVYEILYSKSQKIGSKNEEVAMKRTITFKGSPLTLEGSAVQIGQHAPDFTVVSAELKDVTLSDLTGKVKVITTFPSLDTPVCDLQVKEFNKRATSFSPDVVVVGISKDLPFAQKRFCEMNDIHKVIVLSDYKYSSFGMAYGLLIKELQLLARSVMILDKNDIIRYFSLVSELTQAPDYDGALKVLNDVAKGK
jgi:thioredoxin-dependent peroxiredoxin